MRIGQTILSNENLTIEIRGFTIVSGPRICNRMRTAWNEIPINEFWRLMSQVNLNFVASNLQASNANRIFSAHAARGARYQFSKTTITMCSDNPRYIFMSIEIERSN